MVLRNGCFVLVAAVAWLAASPAPADTYTILNASFGSGYHGSGLGPGLVMDPSGALYGTAGLGGPNRPARGVVFELSRAASGKTWPATTLREFGGAGDGCQPSGGLVRDAGGDLFGTTYTGGAGCTQASFRTLGCGTVFELTPPAAGQTAWGYAVIYSFPGYWSGAQPTGQLVLDPETGVLYGTTYYGGAETSEYADGIVFELMPPASPGGSWTETVLYRFSGGWDGAHPGTIRGTAALTLDGVGGLYGATYEGGCRNCYGTVFHLTPPTGGGTGFWTETILFDFNVDLRWEGIYPAGAVTADASGALYGVANWGTNFSGLIYRLNPPHGTSTRWSETILHQFPGGAGGAGPIGRVSFDSSGALWGVTNSGGSDGQGLVFRLAPPASLGAKWKISFPHNFSGGSGDGAGPEGDLLQDPAGTFYGTTLNGGAHAGGTVFKISP